MRGGKIRIEGFTCFDVPVEVDLDAIGPGVVAVTGPNGAGKTTFMEASGPGILYGEFPYRDPAKIQWWAGPRGGKIERTFHLGDDTYEARIEVPSKGGTPAGYLKRVGTSRPLASGKISDYKDAILRLVGPQAAFLAGNYGVQGGGGRFGALGVTDRKALFRYYLELDRVEACHQKAKARASKIDGAAYERLVAEVATIHDQEIPAARQAAHDREKAVEQWTRAIDTARRRFAEVAEQAALVKLITTYEQAMDRIDRADAAVDKIASQQPESAGGDVKEIRARIDAARAELDRWRKEAAALGNLRLTRENVSDDLERQEESRDGLSSVPCGGAGKYATCPYLQTALKNIAAIPTTKLKLEGVDALIAQAAKTDPEGKAVEVRNEINDLTDAERTAEAAARWVADLDAAKKEAVAARRAALDIRKQLPKEIPEDLPDQTVIDSLREKVAEGERMQRAAIDASAKAKAALQDAEERHKSKIAERDRAAKAASDYPAIQTLIRALGPTGIQALEIDAAGPKVSGIANDLLRACFGTRFSIEVRTLKEYRDKSRAGEYQEDFSIRVNDEQAGIENTMDGICGGERVIVDEALRSALSLFSRERSGAPIETLWRDECFANLYPPNDLAYVSMLRRVREIGNFWQAFYVANAEMARAADREIHFAGAGEVVIR